MKEGSILTRFRGLPVVRGTLITPAVVFTDTLDRRISWHGWEILDSGASHGVLGNAGVAL
jgi:hypothetical protein